jgi:hypothetical protein
MPDFKSYAHMQCMTCRMVLKMPVEVVIASPLQLFENVDPTEYSHLCRTGTERGVNQHDTHGIFRLVGFAPVAGSVIIPRGITKHGST